MKCSVKKLFSICALSLIASNVYSMPVDFVGKWKNINAGTRGVVQIEVAPDMSMHMWGACTPTPCDNGITPLVTFGKDVSDLNHRVAMGHYKYNFKEVGVVLKLSGRQRLSLEHFNKFTDGSARQNYYMTEIFKKLMPIDELLIPEELQ
jgi:hypothetical protein